MKTIFRGTLALLAAAALMTGCVKKKTEGVIRVASFSTDPAIMKIYNEAYREIEKRHPGLRIQSDAIPYGSYNDKIITLFAAKSAPDLVSVEVNAIFGDLYRKGVFEDLTPYVERDKMDLKAYYPTVLKRFSPGGRLYAIPSDTAPTGLIYYNKKIFKEAGVPYPDGKWRWPEPFLTICKKLTKRDANGKVVRWAYSDAYGINGDNFLFSNGGYYMDNEENPTKLAMATPQAMEAWRFRWAMSYTSHVAPTRSELEGVASGAGVGGEGMFMNGQAAMMCSGIWHVPRFKLVEGLDFDVTEFPAGPKGIKGWGTGGSGVAMVKNSTNKELAWIVMKEITGPELSARLAATGLMQPALIKVAQSPAFVNAPPEHRRILLDMPNYSHYMPFMAGWDELLKSDINPNTDRVWYGKKKPDEVFPELISRLNGKYFSKKP
jgi:multiple sugar transport system substrate-binding protein